MTVICCGDCCETLWKGCLLGLFLWPVRFQLVWMMAAVRMPLATVTQTMVASTDVANRASCLDCAALQWAWQIVADVSVYLAKMALIAVKVSATLTSTTAANITLMQRATRAVTVRSLTQASVTEQLWWAWCWLFCVGCRCSRRLTVVRVILVSEAAWAAGAASNTLVELASWAVGGINGITTHVTDCSYSELDCIQNGILPYKHMPHSCMLHVVCILWTVHSNHGPIMAIWTKSNITLSLTKYHNTDNVRVL